MKITAFKNKLNQAADAVEIPSFTFDWTQVVDDNPSQDYPLLLVNPPVGSGSPFSDQPHEQYTLVVYAFRRNVNPEGRKMSSPERDEAWEYLSSLLDEWLSKLLENRAHLALINNERKLTPDEGKIGVDDLVFVKMECKIRATQPC